MSSQNSLSLMVQCLPKRILKLLRVIAVGRDEIDTTGTFLFIGQSVVPGNLLTEPWSVRLYLVLSPNLLKFLP